MDNNVKMVPALCTQCGGTVEVNKDDETAVCPFCGTSDYLALRALSY